MRRLPLLVVAVALVAAALAVWLFPRAFPILAVQQSLTRELALAKADSFFRAHALADTGARTAVRFAADDSLRTFVELAGGGHDSLEALVRGKDVAPLRWSVRSFTPGSPREARADFAPDGRIIGFTRRLAEADTASAVTQDSGQALARGALGGWMGERLERWTLVSSSFETRKKSDRIDRTYTFERTDRRIAAAPIRADVVVAGNAVVKVRQYVRVPESFLRRYAEMRSWNDALALLAALGMLGIAIAGIVTLARCARQRQVRWRAPLTVGGVIGVLMLAAGLNEMPGSWFGYDTAMSTTTFQAFVVMSAIGGAVATALLVGFTLAAAEAATRRAFPHHLDWWKLWRYRGTREVAGRVGGGYAVAAIGFAYVALFYLATRTLLGWWVPSELLDDPNQIATPMPWVSGLALSLQAGVWEEAMFRALPLSLFALWIGDRPHRRWWLAGAVAVSALIFGFGHSNYESWPPYSRGVEIFLDASFWAVLFLAFGLVVTVIAHFLYDAVLFGLFAAQGSAPEYRVTAAIILVALLAPALAVVWRRLRQGAWTPLADDARFAAWTPGEEQQPEAVVASATQWSFTPRSRRLAVAAAIIGVIIAVGRPRQPALGPQFTADRARAVQVADGMLRAHAGNPAAWTHLVMTGTDSLTSWSRFLREQKLEKEAPRLASTYAVPTWWVVRYVKTSGTAAQRAEEWRVRVWPDGRPLDTRHIIPDAEARPSPDTTTARRIARTAMAAAGIDTLVLRETNVEETARPARRDFTFTYTDTSVKLPAGAQAKVTAQVAGNEALLARRGIELSETWIRGDRQRQTNRVLAMSMSMLGLIGLVIAGVVFAKRRRPALVHDGALEGRQRMIGIGALIVLLILSGANAMPSRLYEYDTAQPWGTFVGTSMIGLVAGVVFALILFGLWLVLSAMRRRAGIPMLGGRAPDGARETVLAGLGLGGMAYCATSVTALAARGDIPRPPGTILDQYVPVLAHLPDVPGDILASIVSFGIPVLMIAALARRWPQRIALAAVMIALLVVAGAAMEPAQHADPVMATLALLSAAAVIGGVISWGPQSGASWFVASAWFYALGALRDAVYGPEWQSRTASSLAALAALAVIAIVYRRVGRQTAEGAGNLTAGTVETVG